MESPQPAQRRRLVPLWAIIVPAVVLLAGVGLVAYALFARQTALLSVPNVTNLDVTVARSRLAEQGLLLKRGDRRFSPSVPVDSVIDQTPSPGIRVPRGSYVTVVVSAGSESFPMPDVTGLPLQTARESLQAKGLVVLTEVVASSQPKNTVVSSTPGAGITVSSSDTIRLAVSSGAATSTAIQPSDLTGKVFIIDPAPPAGQATDTPMEVQRRLNSLLEASGARVYVTRTITDTGPVTSDASRALRARTASATAVIGLDVRGGAPGGIALTSMQPLKVSSAVYLGSVQLSQALVLTLNGIAPGVRASEVPKDPVLQSVDGPGVRVSLGSTSDRKDLPRLSDPAWEDRVAGAIYAAIATVYGSK
jgi:N-acetylmuramoyl-L-alanine amidase